MSSYSFDLLDGMFGLQWIALRMHCGVGIFHFHLMSWYLLDRCSSSCSHIAAERGAVPDPCPFHLMEDWIMASIDCIAAVDIRTDQEAVTFVRSEDFVLVC